MKRFNEELEKVFGVRRTADYRETRFPSYLIEMAEYAIYYDDLSQFQSYAKLGAIYDDNDEEVHINLKKAREILNAIRKEMFERRRRDLNARFGKTWMEK